MVVVVGGGRVGHPSRSSISKASVTAPVTHLPDKRSQPQESPHFTAQVNTLHGSVVVVVVEVDVIVFEVAVLVDVFRGHTVPHSSVN